jgi:hypothetical protein
MMKDSHGARENKKPETVGDLNLKGKKAACLPHDKQGLGRYGSLLRFFGQKKKPNNGRLLDRL